MTAIERLGYANGQRLAANDFQLEQQYHILIRRLLNKGLFTSGVVNGLEVDKDPAGSRTVRVRPGLALDPQGREIVVTTHRTVDVPNRKPLTNPLGWFVLARYAQQNVPATDSVCGAQQGPPGVARVVEEPEIFCSETVPDPHQCQPGDHSINCSVVLGLVVVSDACEVAHIQTGVRDYAYPVRSSQVQAIAFEGEKDIDADNPKTINFKILGGSPARAELYLWAGKFSSLYYSELGGHSHSFDDATGSATTTLAAHTHAIPDHRHPSPTVSPHRHKIFVNRNDLGAHVVLGVPQYTKGRVIARNSPVGTNNGYDDIDPATNEMPYIQDTTVRTDATTGSSNSEVTRAANPTTGTGSEQHRHSIPPSESSGVTDYPARSGAAIALKYIDHLVVELDSVDVTKIIIDRLPLGWTALGDGQSAHPLNGREGTGPIDLLDVSLAAGLDLTTNQTHTITLSVPRGNGGKILYNLYVA